MASGSRTSRQSSVPWAVLAVIAVLILVAGVRLRVADVPLERDEGEFAYAGRLIMEGIPPYAIAYNMKFPGVYYAYALIMALFGRTPWGIHVGLLLVNAATTVVVFAIGRKLLGELGGAVAAVSFAVLSLDREIFGVFAHATHFVILAATIGLLLLMRAMETERTSTFIWSGVLFGVAVLMKQHAILFLPFAAVLAFDRSTGGRRVGALALGAALPVLVVVATLAAQGVLARFWFWTFRYASAYVSELTLDEARALFVYGIGKALSANLAFWVVGVLGLAALWIAPWSRASRIALTGWLVASFLAVCPGFYFRPHYFIVMLPAVALLCGVALESLRQTLTRTLSRGVASAVTVAVLFVPIGLFVTKERRFLFTMGTLELSRDLYSVNPFIEAVEIGRYIRDHSDERDRIAVLGSEPEIYFYAERKGATGYIYTYALMESQPFAARMQDEMIREIESAQPRYLIFCQSTLSWLKTDSSNERIFDWADAYITKCFDQVGVVDIISEQNVRIVWDGEARDYTPTSSEVVYTYRRKSDQPCSLTIDSP